MSEAVGNLAWTTLTKVYLTANAILNSPVLPDGAMVGNVDIIA